VYIYSVSSWENLQFFDMVFLIIQYNEITQDPYINNWTDNGQCNVGVHLRFEIVQRAQLMFLATRLISLIFECGVNSACMMVCCLQRFTSMPSCFSTWNIVTFVCVWNLEWQCTCCYWTTPKAFSRRKDSF